MVSGRHVALIGPGGMGKSCIARAVLHDQAISGQYSPHRYFVRYDDMNASHVTLSTFLDRIARALDIKSSRANQLSVISIFLASHKILLVLDNAEVFLDAGTDAGRIADTVDGFAALPGVVLMLTTRTKALPANLLCTRISVPPLDESAALEAFSAIYHTSLPLQVIKKLLVALEFHPLSINLLAQAALQNEWSPENLAVSWEQQKANLLEIGQGKIQSLAVTIELSLNSPSLQHLGSSLFQFLQIAAFLPQGVNEQNLEDLFPGVADIHTIVSKLSKQSLVYCSGNFITMLAPIRLYISSQYNNVTSAILALKHIRSYYRDRLSRTTDVNEFIEKNTVVLDEEILNEHLNIEHLVNYDLVNSQNKLKSLSFCLAYLKNLRQAQHPQPTALHAAILSISNTDFDQVHLWNFHLKNPFTRRQCLVFKGYCLMQLGFLARGNRQSRDTIELFLAAKEVFLSVPDQKALGYCLDYLGDQYITLGQLTTAEKALEDAMKVSHKLKDFEREASISISLARVKIYRGKSGVAELLSKSQKYFQDHGDQVMAFDAQFYQGLGEYYHKNYIMAKHHFEACLIYNRDTGDTDIIIACLWQLGTIASEIGKYEEAHEHFDEARLISLKRGKQGDAGLSLALKAVITSDQQDFVKANEQIDIAISESTQDGCVNDAPLHCIYISARNYLLAGQYAKSKDAFIKALDISEALTDIRMKAKSLRGIGEIAVLENNFEKETSPSLQSSYSVSLWGSLHNCFTLDLHIKN